MVATTGATMGTADVRSDLLDVIRGRLIGHPLVRRVDGPPTGHVRVETVWRYPDGDPVDVFVDAKRSRSDGAGGVFVLTDFGNTLGVSGYGQTWGPGFGAWHETIAAIQREVGFYGVWTQAERLECRADGLEGLADVVGRLAMACANVSGARAAGDGRGE